MKTQLNQHVQQLLTDLTAAGVEVGLQVAAYLDGELIVDTWAGVADETTGRAVTGETLFTSWSTTKGFVATCIHLLAERGQLDYDAPIATYWPEFAAHGKGQITVRHALTHTAGIPHMPKNVTVEMMTDWPAMCTAIAGHAPLWSPGAKVGYHAWTFGWILGEIVRRVDGRPLAQFAQAELCQPLAISDFYLGIPDDVETRVAPLRQETDPLATVAPDEPSLQVTPPHVTNAAAVNRPDFRRASIPGGGGIMNARAIARHYALLAGHGTLNGVRLLSPERIDLMRTCQTAGLAGFFGGVACFGLGYGLGGDPAQGASPAMGSTGGEFGHGGYGGSLGFADPARKLSFGLTKNLMKEESDPKKSTAYQVATAIREQVDAGRI
ncbi:MAG: serine hydrolase domain-containing protein [Caldilineaceae bacterium]